MYLYFACSQRTEMQCMVGRENQEQQILKSVHELGSKMFAETYLLCYFRISTILGKIR